MFSVCGLQEIIRSGNVFGDLSYLSIGIYRLDASMINNSTQHVWIPLVKVSEADAVDSLKQFDQKWLWLVWGMRLHHPFSDCACILFNWWKVSDGVVVGSAAIGSAVGRLLGAAAFFAFDGLTPDGAKADSLYRGPTSALIAGLHGLTRKWWSCCPGPVGQWFTRSGDAPSLPFQRRCFALN